MQEDIIHATYDKIVKPGLSPMFQAYSNKENVEQFQDDITSLLTCYYLKFISHFRAFLDPKELIDIAQFSSYLLTHPH